MTALLLALLTVLGVAVVLSVVLAAFLAAPFVIGIDLAERRGMAAQPAGALLLVLAAAAVLVAVRAFSSPVLFALAAVLAWAGPLLVRVIPLGRPGAHER